MNRLRNSFFFALNGSAVLRQKIKTVFGLLANVLHFLRDVENHFFFNVRKIFRETWASFVPGALYVTSCTFAQRRKSFLFLSVGKVP